MCTFHILATMSQLLLDKITGRCCGSNLSSFFLWFPPMDDQSNSEVFLDFHSLKGTPSDLIVSTNKLRFGPERGSFVP